MVAPSDLVGNIFLDVVDKTDGLIVPTDGVVDRTDERQDLRDQPHVAPRFRT